MHKNKSQPELADIFRKYGEDYRHSNFLSIEQSKTMYHIEICWTAVLWGHTEACDHCGFKKNAYNSCRDRHLSRKSGWMPGSLNCCPVHIFTTSLLYPMSSTLSF